MCGPSLGMLTGATMVRTRCSVASCHCAAPRSRLITTCSLESRTPDHVRSSATTSLASAAPAPASHAARKASIWRCGLRKPSSGLLAAYQPFLRGARDQAAVAREYAGAREAARARSAGTVDGVQQPLVHAQRAVKPHGVVDARHDERRPQKRGAVRERRGIEQEEVRDVREQPPMQHLIVGKGTHGAKPDFARRRLAPRLQVIDRPYHAELEGPRLL